jgi:hypothetical protein
VSPVIKEIFELLNSRLQQLRDDAETCSSEIAGAELVGRMKEICVVLDWLRSHVVNKFSERMARARAKVQVLLH